MVANNNLTHRIVEALGRLIVSGQYNGKPFPIEADLCSQFGASRSVLREAVKMLTAKGLISSRPRLGTRVEPESNWNFLDPDVLRWLLERGLSLELLSEFVAFRQAIEPQAAILAIRNATDADKDGIRDAIEAMHRAEQGEGDPLQCDIDFHVSVLRASRNRFMIQCKELVETTLRFSIQLTNELKGVPIADVGKHQAIADGILAGDADKAVSATLSLLEEAAGLIKLTRERQEEATGGKVRH